MLMAKKNVATIAQTYWLAGMVKGLLLADLCALLVCAFDLMHFWLRGGSIQSVLRFTTETFLKGESLGAPIAVLAFLLIALPMLAALLSAFVASSDRWPGYLGARSRAIMTTHILLTGIIVVFTMAAITMEMQFGYLKTPAGLRFSFASAWLAIVSFGHPVYVAYISPVLRKFLARFTANPGKPVHTLRDVVSEVGTEGSIGGAE